MDREGKESLEEPVVQPAPRVDPDLIPADAERTIEREEERGVARADHNLEENTGSEAPDAEEKKGR